MCERETQRNKKKENLVKLRLKNMKDQIIPMTTYFLLD